MSAVVLYGVVTRYGLQAQPFWTEELARLLMIWLTFIGGAHAFVKGSHIRVDVLQRRLPERHRELLDTFTLFISFIFLALIASYSLSLAHERADILTPALQISSAVFILPLTVGAGIMCLVCLLRLAQRPGRVLLWTGAAAALCVGAFLVARPALAEISSGGGTLPYLLVGFIVLLALGTPVAFCLGLTAVSFLMAEGTLPMAIVPQRMEAGVDSFVLLAVPLFLFAGALMETGGISRRLVEFAIALVGHARGGLGMVVVLTTYLFSGISGSTTADVAAVGSVLIPAMRKAGYSKEEAVSIVSASAAMGILVPPSVHMVVLGTLVGVSVSALFIGGFVPAAILALVLLAVVYVKARRAGWPTMPRSSRSQLGRAALGAIVPMLTPAIIFGGIFSGLATITESAVLALTYAFVVSVVVYRELTPRALRGVLADSASSSGMALWLVAGATVFGWVMTTNHVPELVGEAMRNVSTAPAFFLIVTILVYVIFSGLLEGLPSLLIFAPILFPVAISLGIDPVHYGLISIAALGIGFFLPPVGLGLFIACGIAQADVIAVTRVFWVYLVILIIALAVISLFPDLSLFLPRLFGVGGA